MMSSQRRYSDPKLILGMLEDQFGSQLAEETRRYHKSLQLGDYPEESLPAYVDAYLSQTFTDEAMEDWRGLLAENQIGAIEVSPYDTSNFMMDLMDVNEAQEMPALFRIPTAEQNGIVSTYETFMPRGKLCILASEGGVGKSLLCLHLGISLALNRPTSLKRLVSEGHPKIEKVLGRRLEPIQGSGKVVILYAEEDRDTCRLRLKKLLPKERDGRISEVLLSQLSGRLIPVPLDEINDDITLSTSSRFSDYSEAEKSEARFMTLMSNLNKIAGNDGIDLIVIDPLAQFGGPDFEKDNGEANSLMKRIKRLTTVKGKPTVLLVHHSPKGSKGARGNQKIRGASALTGGARWTAGLERVHDEQTDEPLSKDGKRLIEFRIGKSNYTREDIVLRYMTHGAEIMETPNNKTLQAKTQGDFDDGLKLAEEEGEKKRYGNLDRQFAESRQPVSSRYG